MDSHATATLNRSPVFRNYLPNDAQTRWVIENFRNSLKFIHATSPAGDVAGTLAKVQLIAKLIDVLGHIIPIPRSTMISDQFEHFRQEAISYCSLVEASDINEEDFIERLQSTLITLYQIACQLPEIALNGECKAVISDSDFNSYLPNLSKLLPFQYYWQVLDPFDHYNIETGCGDLFDDIGDIYKDLKRELFYLNSNEPSCEQEGCWMVKWDFDYHWGKHCIDALTAIHHFKARI